MPVTPSAVAEREGRPQSRGAGARDAEAKRLDVSYKLNERLEREHGRPRRHARRPTRRSCRSRRSKATAPTRSCRLEYDSKGALERVRVRAGHGVRDRRPRGQRPRRHGRLLSRLAERCGSNAEVSDGDLGPGGKLGTSYMPNDRTTVYLNYALENESADAVLQPGAAGVGGGNLTAGVKTRLSDSSSVYLEERYRSASYMSGLTHSTGVNLVADGAPEFRREHRHRHAHGHADRCRDEAPSGRRSASATATSALQLSSGVEYRTDDVEQPDLSFATPQHVAVPEQLQVPAQPKRRAWSASSTTRRARARSGSSTTAATPKPCSATRIAPCATTG